MNKRQRKKKYKKILTRMKYLNKQITISGRRNGKHFFIRRMTAICISKKYKQLKDFKKGLCFSYIAYDLSNGKDYSVRITYKYNKDITTIIKSEVIN